jgi:hypothetical protein
MSKVLINFTVEEHIAIAFKTKVAARERSSAIENFMSAMTNVKLYDEEEEQLVQEVEEIRNEIHLLSNRLSERYALLEMKRKTTIQNDKVKRVESEAIYDSILTSNPMDR